MLTTLGARLRGVDDDVPFVPDAASLRRIRVLTLSTTAGDLDVLVEPAGSPPYGQLRSDALVFELDGALIPVASVDHLLAMKRAAGRPKDLLEIEELEAIRRIQAG